MENDLYPQQALRRMRIAKGTTACIVDDAGKIVGGKAKSDRGALSENFESSTSCQSLIDKFCTQ